MGRIGRVLSFVRSVINGAEASEAKVTFGASYNVTAEHFSAPGDDGHPLAGDYLIMLTNGREGGVSAVGYIDPLNAGKAAPGEKRMYGRSAAGAPVCEVWCKADGSVVLSNDNGNVTLAPDGSTIATSPGGSFALEASGQVLGQNSNGQFDLQAGGDFVVNGVTIDTAGNITTPTTVTANTVDATATLTAAGKNIGVHDHPAGTPPGDTGVNN